MWKWMEVVLMVLALAFLEQFVNGSFVEAEKLMFACNSLAHVTLPLILCRRRCCRCSFFLIFPILLIGHLTKIYYGNTRV